jgi:hypothetical protein
VGHAHVHDGLLDSDAVWTYRWVPALLSLSSELCAWRQYVSPKLWYPSSWCYNPEEHHGQLYNIEDLKYQIRSNSYYLSKQGVN